MIIGTCDEVTVVRARLWTVMLELIIGEIQARDDGDCKGVWEFGLLCRSIDGDVVTGYLD